MTAEETLEKFDFYVGPRYDREDAINAMQAYARQVGEAVKQACIKQIEMIFKEDGDLERDINVEDFLK